MYETLHSINPRNYNNLFSSRTTNKKKKILFKNIFNNQIKKENSSIFIISPNQFNNTFNFNKTDIVPFPKFPQIKKIKKNTKNSLFSKIKKDKKKNYFSVKYLELIKDINNQNILKNYYYLNKKKSITEDNKKIIRIFLDTDIDSLKKGIHELYDLKNILYEKNNNNQINEIKNICNKNYNRNFSRNIFLKEILNNINRQVEIYSKENKELDVIFVKNLLVNELNKLEKNIYNIKKDIKILVKENYIKNAYNNDPSKAFNLSSSSSSSDNNNQNVSNNKYLQILIKNQNKDSSGVKNFKNEYDSLPSQFSLTQGKFNNLSLSQTIITSNYPKEKVSFKPCITDYNFKGKNNNNKILNGSKASELIKEISNKIEKKYGQKENIIKKNDIINEILISPEENNSNSNSSIIISKKKDTIKTINHRDLLFKNNSDFYIKKKSRILNLTNPINEINNNKVNIKNKYIPKNNVIIEKKKVKFPSHIIIEETNKKEINIRTNKEVNKKKEEKKEEKNNKIEEHTKNNNNLNNNNIIIESNNINKINKLSEEKKEESIENIEKKEEEKPFDANYSIMKLFEEIKRNAMKKKKTKKINRNDSTSNIIKSIEKKRNKKVKSNNKKKEEKEKNIETEKEIRQNTEENIQNQKFEFNKFNTMQKIKPALNKLSKEKLLEEVNILRKEILQPKNLLVKNNINKNNKMTKINKKELKDIKNKLAIINNIQEMNFKSEEKEVLLNNIFDYNFLLNKNPKTPEEIEKEEEIRKKIKAIIEKYIYELQISELINKKSIFSRKKNNVKKKLNFIKNLNIFEDEKINEIEEQIFNQNIRDKEKEKTKMNFAKNEEEIDDKKNKLKFKTMSKRKKEGRLIFDNSYMFKKPKKKKEIKEEVKKIINTNYALINDNINSSINNTIISNSDENKSFISNVSKSINKSRFFDIKSKNFSRRNSNFSNIREGFRSKFIEKISEEERKKREEEIRRKNREIEEQKRKDEILDKRLYEFFEKIKKLKNSNNSIDYQDELEKLIDERTANIINIKEIRINDFIHALEFNREKEKFYIKFKNKKLGYNSPLIFTMNNFYLKDRNNTFDNNNIDNENIFSRTVYKKAQI